ncbi:MAG: hypothetical protein IKY08_02550 [Firmicutes bacterium]|nr:hypothetical protein [Bacillota bacterium]
MKRRAGRTVAIGVALGISLGFITSVLDIDRDVFMKYYIVAAILIVVGVFLYNLLYIRKHNQEMNQAINLLNEGKTEEYMVRVSELERKVKGKALKNLMRLNLTAGYCDLKEYEKALEILETLRKEKLKGDVELVWRLNTCLCYFYTGRRKEAMQLYNESKALFSSSKKKGLHVPNIAILDMLAMIEDGRKKEARQYLEFAREKWPQMRLEEDYRMIDALLNKK